MKHSSKTIPLDTGIFLTKDVQKATRQINQKLSKPAVSPRNPWHETLKNNHPNLWSGENTDVLTTSDDESKIFEEILHELSKNRQYSTMVEDLSLDLKDFGVRNQECNHEEFLAIRKTQPPP